MNLLIDQGNTSIKLALSENQLIRSKKSYTQLSVSEVEVFLKDCKIDQAILSSVGNRIKLPSILMELVDVDLNIDTLLPFKINYSTPDTLGNDRRALVAGSMVECSSKNRLIIDLGSCITYDFIDDSNTYQGGIISPGLRMRSRAMNTFTSNLPEVEPNEPKDIIGRSTEECMQLGLNLAIFKELEGIIESYEKRYPDLICLLTGGDYFHFGSLVKNSIFAAPDLLLNGLNHILEYNVKTQ